MSMIFSVINFLIFGIFEIISGILLLYTSPSCCALIEYSFLSSMILLNSSYNFAIRESSKGCTIKTFPFNLNSSEILFLLLNFN